MLGVPSLPSFASRRWRGDSEERGACGERAGCDCAEEEDEFTVRVGFSVCLDLVSAFGPGFWEACSLGGIRNVALGSWA